MFFRSIFLGDYSVRSGVLLCVCVSEVCGTYISREIFGAYRQATDRSG